MIDFLSFLLEIVAVFVGVLAAFWLDNRRERQQEQRTNQLALKLIATEIAANIKTEEKMAASFQESVEGVPYNRLGTAWRTIANNLTIITDTKFLIQIANLYSNFDVINRALEVYEQHAALAIAASDVTTENFIMKRLAYHRHFLLETITNKETGLEAAKNAFDQIRQKIKS